MRWRYTAQPEANNEYGIGIYTAIYYILYTTISHKARSPRATLEQCQHDRQNNMYIRLMDMILLTECTCFVRDQIMQNVAEALSQTLVDPLLIILQVRKVKSCKMHKLS